MLYLPKQKPRREGASDRNVGKAAKTFGIAFYQFNLSTDLGLELDAVCLARLKAREGEAGQLAAQLPLTVPLRHVSNRDPQMTCTHGTLIKKKMKFSSYIRKFRGIGCTARTVGCSDFDFFHILRYNHPSLTP